jgi:filamentous hemagglutinin
LAGAHLPGLAISSTQTRRSDYASVSQHSGIQAGDNGVQVSVEGNMNLNDGAIASTRKAVDEARDSLTTGSLRLSDIGNHSTPLERAPSPQLIR